MKRRNIVDTEVKNEVVKLLLEDRNQVITVDANFFMSPDRSSISSKIKAFNFDKFEEIWIGPLLKTFKCIAIHEAVYDELLGETKILIDKKLEKSGSPLKLLLDDNLSYEEKIIRDTIEKKISPNTNYLPSLNNKDDRGEVKTLAHIATVGLIYFGSHDNNAINLIDCADELDTGLQMLRAIKTYEILYIMYRLETSNKKDLRNLYKYLYYLTKNEKNKNPSWSEFIEDMDKLYD
jgi:hypothetical protein